MSVICEKVCIVFLLCFVIRISNASCLIKYKPGGRSTEDKLSINSGRGPLIYTYSTKGPEVRHPIITRDEFCLYFSEDDKKQPDDRINLACPGHNVRIEGYVSSVTAESTYLTESQSTAELRFIFNSTFVEKVYMYPSTLVKCTGNTIHEMRISETIRSTRVYPIGVKLNNLYFLPFYRILKDSRPGSHIIGHVKIPSTIEYRPKLDESGNYKIGLIYSHRLNYTKMYSGEYQMQQFKDLRVEQKAIEEYFSDGNYLVKGNLVSKEHLFYNAQQMGIYYYENTIPVWRSIYEGNWKTVSNIIRKSADQTFTDWEVFTVPIGDLQIRNSTKLYLGFTDANLRIPHLLARVIFSSKNPEHGIVFYTANDPHITANEWSEILDPRKGVCKNHLDCKEDFPDFLKASKGLTFCCSLVDSSIAKAMKEYLEAWTNEHVQANKKIF